MAINFNEAKEQRESVGPIPAGSMVKVRLEIRAPKPGEEGSDPALTLSKKADCEMLNCEFEVTSGTFKGKKIWNNYVVAGSTDGHAKAAQISMSTLRAITEAMRGISPKDQSPAACQARVLGQWWDLSGAEVGIVVGIVPPKPGDRYVNNDIKRIITADADEYRQIMAGGEIISDAPVPEIAQPTAATAAPAWAAPPKPAVPATPVKGTLPVQGKAPWQASAKVATAPPPVAGGMPAWGTPNGGQMPPPPAFPSQASGMDDVPF